MSMSDHTHPTAPGGGHKEAADEVEAEIDGLAQESERLETDIDDTRADWESRKGDEKVPGADDGGADSTSGSEEREGADRQPG